MSAVRPIAPYSLQRAHRGTAVLAAGAFLAALAGCGGAGIGLAVLTVGGTAALGKPVANAAVVLVDSKGQTASTTTDAAGHYEIKVEGLTPPFLVRITPQTGNPLFTVAKAPGTANADVFSNLLLETIYKLTTTTPAAEFALLTSTTTSAGDIPSPVEIAALQDLFELVLESWLQKSGVDPVSWTLLETPFRANGAGYDELLDKTIVVGGDVTIQDSTATQTTSITTSGSGTVTADTAVTTAQGTTNTTYTTLVPSTDAAQAAIDDIESVLDQLANTANQHGSGLTDTDIVPYFEVDFLGNGVNRTVFSGQAADFFRPYPIQLDLLRVSAFDSQVAPMLVTADLLVTRTVPGGISREIVPDMVFNFNATDNAFRLFGNRRTARVEVHTIRDLNITSTGQTTKTNTELTVAALRGTLSSVSANGGPFVGSPITSPFQITDAYDPQPGTTVFIDLDEFHKSIDTTSSTPAASQIYTVTLTPVSGPTSTVTLAANEVEGETITGFQVDAPGAANTHSRAAAIGQTLTVRWNLPAGYELAQISVEAQIVDNLQNRADLETSGAVPATATSATITIPAIVPGGGAVTDLTVSVDFLGVNNESSAVDYQFDQP